jgi:hypothetical protein
MAIANALKIGLGTCAQIRTLGSDWLMFSSQLETVCTLPKIFPLFRLQDFLAIQIWYFEVDFSWMQLLPTSNKQMYLDHLLQLTT